MDEVIDVRSGVTSKARQQCSRSPFRRRLTFLQYMRCRYSPKCIYECLHLSMRESLFLFIKAVGRVFQKSCGMYMLMYVYVRISSYIPFFNINKGPTYLYVDTACNLSIFRRIRFLKKYACVSVNHFLSHADIPYTFSRFLDSSDGRTYTRCTIVVYID